MATLNIEGRNVTVDDSFLKLPTDQQHATVDEIAKSLGVSGKSSSAQPRQSFSGSVLPFTKDETGVHFDSNAGLVGLAKRAFESAYSGATLPGDVMAGNASPEDTGRVLDLAAVALPISPAARTGKAIAEGAGLAKPQVAKPAVPTIEQLDASAAKGYESPEVTSLEIRPRAIRDFGESAQLHLSNEGSDPELAPKTFSILSKLSKVPEDAIVTGQNVNTLRKILSGAADSADSQERRAATLAIQHLDEFLPKVLDRDVIAGDTKAAQATLENARGDYSAARQAERIDKKVNDAELRAASVNSGENVANKVRQKLAETVIKPAENRGLTDEETAAAEQIVRGTRGQNALRYMANKAATLPAAAVGGTIGNVFGPVGVPIGTAIPGMASWAMKSLANKMTLKQADRLSEMIRSRAPLASSMQKFEEKAGAFSSSPSPATMAGISLAARNLSMNLRSAGFDFSPSDLMRGFQGSVPAGADQEQQ